MKTHDGATYRTGAMERLNGNESRSRIFPGLQAILMRVGFAVLVTWLANICDSFACGPEWTNLGTPPWGINSVVQSSADPCTFICGASRNFQFQNSGGVYRRTSTDSTWEYMGLVYHSILELRRFAFNQQSIFAATSEGLYRSDDDGYTWNLLTEIGSGGDRDQVSFAISPNDSTEWLLGSMELGDSRLYFSHNSGQNWEAATPRPWPNDLTYSSLNEHIVYMADYTALSSYNTDSDSLEILHQFWAQDVLTLAQDTIRHSIFFTSEDSLGKYNELTGEISIVPIPGDGYSYRVLFWPPDSLIVGTQDGLYAVDLELEHWRNISDGLAGPFRPWLCTESILIVSSSTNAYCRNVLPSPAHDEPVFQISRFMAYPNPTNAYITVLSDVSCDVRMYNVLGHVVHRFAVVEDVGRTISLGGFASGTYYFAQSMPVSRFQQQIVVPIVVTK